MKRTLLIMICLMAMVVSANAQNVLYKNGNVAIETYTLTSGRSLVYDKAFPEKVGRVVILIPIERLEEFVSLLEKSTTLFEKYERIVEGLDIHSYDNTKVKLKGLNFKTKIGIRTNYGILSGKWKSVIGLDGVNFEFYCKTKCEIDGSKKPYLILSGEGYKSLGYNKEIELVFESTYDIMNLIKALDKDSFTELAKEEKRKEELRIKQQEEEENRKKQVESALQQAFN